MGRAARSTRGRAQLLQSGRGPATHAAAEGPAAAAAPAYLTYYPTLWRSIGMDKPGGTASHLARNCPWGRSGEKWCRH
eukprot:9468444-Pyramimonas_sp.AAC.2